MRILKLSHYAKNLKKGPFRLFNFQFVPKYQKIEGGPFGDIRNFSEKVSMPKKKSKRGPISHIRFCMLR